MYEKSGVVRNERKGSLDASRNAEQADNNDLIDSSKNGDENAFEKLWNLELRAIRAIFSKVYNEQDKEELVATAKLHVWQGMASYDSQAGSWKNWVKAIAYNVLRDYLNKKSAKKVNRPTYSFSSLTPGGFLKVGQVDDIGDFVPVEEREDSLGLLLKKEQARLLEEKMKQLTDVERRAIELRYLHDLGEKEVASIMGISRSNAANVLTRARRKLKKILAPETQIGL